MPLNFDNVRALFDEFRFDTLFIEELGWSRPKGIPLRTIEAGGQTFSAKPIAELGGVVVFEATSAAGDLPNAKTRMAVQKELAKTHYENLIIFVDSERSRCEWFWVKRENGKELPRPHAFVRGQQGDLFLGKVGPLVFEIKDFESGDPGVADVARRLKLGLDVEKVTKKFYGEFDEQHLRFIDLITGIDDDRHRRWYASVLLNRLMFIWFLQRKGFVDDGRLDYLQDKLEESRRRGKDRYFRDFLRLLFFEGFARPAEDRSPEARERLGNIRYLNGGLFLPHVVELKNPGIDVPDAAFENLFSLFRRYTWNLNDTPGTESNEINPDVLGYIFEKYINQKAFGAYYTRPEITTYLCERTIHKLVLDAVNTPDDERIQALPGKSYAFKSIEELTFNLDAKLCRKLFFETLPRLSILDPACGSGAFLVAAMKTLMKIYGGVIGRVPFVGDPDLKRRVAAIEKEHPSIDYFIKKSIITHNLYGVDIMEEAVEIARLRLFLALVSSAHHVDDLEPLPNIDFNLLPGNSVIGLLRVDETKFDQQGSFIRKSYRQVVEEKTREIQKYRFTSSYHADLRALRDGIEKLRAEARDALDDLLLQHFKDLGIKYEEATWDDRKQREGKGKKRPLTHADIRELQPFHWGYEFDEIVNKRGGFDVILTNPPWESVEPQAKAFFAEHSDLISKNKMDIKDFEKALQSLLRDDSVRSAWLEYLSGYNHQREFFRKAPEYENQIPVIDGRRQGKDINLYKLFLERCMRLLRDGGECGIVIPGGIYSDLGAKRLREWLFESTEITGLFGFENRKEIFENVHRSFKFVVLTFRKGGSTREFPAAFMRHEVGELAGFPGEGALCVTTEVVAKLSPDSLSIAEFQSDRDVKIAKDLIQAPLLGADVGAWRVDLHREFNMTDDAALFLRDGGPGRMPLYEGKMIWQFDAFFAEPRFFVKNSDARVALKKVDGEFEFERYRLAYRDVAANTNERTMVAAVIPPGVVAGHTLHLDGKLPPRVQLYLVSIFNSFVFDWLLRKKVSAHCSIFYVNQMPVPRLQNGDPGFEALVTRAARLSCTAPAMLPLAAIAGIDPEETAIDDIVRAKLRAEIDAIVAHLYGLAEEDLIHILKGFPLVSDETKQGVIQAFREWKPAPDDPLLRIIAGGESVRVEFKASARWDLNLKQVHKGREHDVIRTVAAFLNSEGGTLLLGVGDDGTIHGLERDFAACGKKGADSFENWLTTRLLDSVGKEHARRIAITFHQIEGKTICRVDVQPSPAPVFVEDDKGEERLYIRAGNSTRPLAWSEGTRYIEQHFHANPKPSTPSGSGGTAPDAPRLPILPTIEPAAAAPPSFGLFGGPPSQGRGSDAAQVSSMAVPSPLENVADAARSADGGEVATEESSTERRRLTDQYDVEDVLLHIRDVVNSAEPVPRDEAIREIASRLGAERVGSRIRELIESALTTASRRALIETVNGGLVARTRSIDDYDRDFLKTALRNVIGRTWTDEEEAIRAAARWLGFRRTGHKIEQAFRSAIRGALKQGLLERDGPFLRCERQSE